MKHHCTIALLVFALLSSAAQAQTVVVEFTASWCRYCQKLKPDVIALQKAGYDVRFADVDLDATKRLPGFPNKIPAAVAIDAGTMKLVDSLPNEQISPQALRRFVQKHLKPKQAPVPTRTVAYRSPLKITLRIEHTLIDGNGSADVVVYEGEIELDDNIGDLEEYLPDLQKFYRRESVEYSGSAARPVIKVTDTCETLVKQKTTPQTR